MASERAATPAPPFWRVTLVWACIAFTGLLSVRVWWLGRELERARIEHTSARRALEGLERILGDSGRVEADAVKRVLDRGLPRSRAALSEAPRAWAQLVLAAGEIYARLGFRAEASAVRHEASEVLGGTPKPE